VAVSLKQKGAIINAQLKIRWRSLDAAFEALGEKVNKGG